MSKREIALADAALAMIENADVRELGDLTVSEVARRLNVDRSYLARCVSEYRYLNLGHLLSTKKMTAFSYLVRCEGVPTVKEALEILDIRSPSHFIQKFKAFYGCTPGEMCRQARKIWADIN